MNRCGPHPRLFHTWFRLVPGLFLAIFKRFCDYNIAFGVLRSGSVTHDTLNVAYATVVCTTCYRMFRERYTERWNGFGEPRVHRSVGPRRMQAAERRHPIAAQRHQPVSCGDAPHGSGESERWQHRHHHLPRTPFGTEIFPQDVERRFGITRSTSSRVLALMERKGLSCANPCRGTCG